jgi:hypothetical protein
MKFKNLHQPYLFRKNDKTHLIVSEILTEKFEFVYGGGKMKEEMWKLRYIDENFNITNLETPTHFEYNDEKIYVVAECSGFINNDNISYIIGGHNNEIEGQYTFFLVKGKFNFETKSVENFEIVSDGVRAAFINNDKIFAFSPYDDNIYLNGEFLCNTKNMLNSVIRIMGVYDNEEEMIVTGFNDTYESFILNTKTLEYKKILTNNNDNVIYKSSIIGNCNDGLLVYTDKVFTDTENEYYLNYETGYNLQ